MQYGYYILSSTDPDYYNKISANIQFPFDFKGEVKMTVYTLNTICNIETLNDRDYIELIYEDEDLYRVAIDNNYSKLSPQTMPYIFNELFQKNDLDIICEIDQLDILKFSSKKYFRITEMTYNLQLITGFYYHNWEGHDIVPISTNTTVDNTITKDIIMTHISFADAISNTQQLITPITFLTPLGANSQVYVLTKNIPKEVKAIKYYGKYYYGSTTPGEYIIPVRVQNMSKTLDYNFKLTVIAANDNIKTTKLKIYDFPDKVIVGKKYIFAFNFEPVESYAKSYTIEFKDKDNNTIPTTNYDYDLYSGYISFGFNEAYDNITMIIEEDNNILCEHKFNVLPKISTISEYIIKSKCVGFTLSTPILYLISNVGGKTFRNENRKVIEMQSCNSVMIINNASTPSFPIVAENTTIYTEVDTKDMTKLEFELVDANMRPIKLLNPMYICMMLEPLQRNETQELLEAFKAYDKKTDEMEKKAKELVINQNNLGPNDWKFYDQAPDDSRYSLFRVNEGMKFD